MKIKIKLKSLRIKSVVMQDVELELEATAGNLLSVAQSVCKSIWHSAKNNRLEGKKGNNKMKIQFNVGKIEGNLETVNAMAKVVGAEKIEYFTDKSPENFVIENIGASIEVESFEVVEIVSELFEKVKEVSDIKGMLLEGDLAKQELRHTKRELDKTKRAFAQSKRDKSNAIKREASVRFSKRIAAR